jgi:hypothetical protein
MMNTTQLLWGLPLSRIHALFDFKPWVSELHVFGTFDTKDGIKSNSFRTSMIFMWNTASNFEEEEEEEVVDLNDALLDELADDDDLAPDELTEGEVPLVPPPVVVAEEEEGEDETAKAFFDGEAEEGDDDADLDYDSFDDKDEL